MKLLLSIFSILFVIVSNAQSIEGVIVDMDGEYIPSVKLINRTRGTFKLAGADGKFQIKAKVNDTIDFFTRGFDTTTLIVSTKNLGARSLKIKLFNSAQEISEAHVIKSRLAEFDVGYLPPISGVQITTGTNSVIELSKLNGAKSTANPREIFAKVPGLNIWESDGSGIQIGIGGRGLSPNRAANFNTRQNGYDISADALGYPESYYTPPIEALKSIQIIRGSASLQFGTQFGGLLNFMIKDPPANSPLEFTTRNTAGTYGYLASFNRIAGSAKRFYYQAYYQYKTGNGYRDNSEFSQQQLFAQLGYHITENIKVRLEYTHMDYLARQAGGLTDLQFNVAPKVSLRERNWFNVNWNILALHYDHEFSNKAHFNLRAFGMKSGRNTLGFLGKITQADHNGIRDMISGKFQNAGVEARFLRRYTVFKDTSKPNIRGAFLVGGRYYRGNSTAEQGLATDGNAADFTFQNSLDLENSSYSFPSENLAVFSENIFFLGKRWTFNFGMRLENISSSSEGYYKQYVVHPINNDTIAILTNNDSKSVKRIVPLFGGGVAYSVGKRAKVYTNFTQNYRAINFTDIRITNPNIVVDSLIKDEYGYTAELGFRGLHKDYLIYDLAGFYIFYGDKIGLAPKAGTAQKERTNIGDAQNYGIELFTEIDFVKMKNDSSNHSFSLFVNGAFINANYIRSKEANFIDKKVEYVSSFIFKSGVKYRYKGWSFQLQGSYNSEQFSDASNSVIPSGDAVIGLIPSYFVMDLSTRYTMKKRFQLELSINNLTNASYFTRRASGYPGPGILPSDGIGAYFTLQYQFRVTSK
ncbi:MAG: Fe(3+) dicitrate transport protein [Flavobacteriaceae bacterium]|jgi:Fe(3+) dicitrate transport protein